MIDVPGDHLKLSSADRDTVIAPSEECRGRIEHFLAVYRSRCPQKTGERPCRIELDRVIPEHAGFGSGTQLGMAVAQALSIHAGERDVPAEVLAERVGRGARSALGIHGFQQGGLLVDAGKAPGTSVAPLVARVAFPDSWRFVLITPRNCTGVSGEAERDAFAELPGMQKRTTDALCGIVVRSLLPAAIEADFQEFGEAVYRFGQIVGDYFAPAQGGIYADRRMEELVGHLRSAGIRGVGQTSWGPTIFALCEDTQQAEQLKRDLADRPPAIDCHLRIAAPRNRGACIDSAPASPSAPVC